MILIGPLSLAAFSITWLLVTTWPFSSKTQPEPVAPAASP